MFPIAILISTTAMLCGIGGAALFTPLMLLVFPLLGNQYVLDDPVTAITAALMTSTFGFASGFLAYFRKGLIDFSLAKSFLLFSIPSTIIGVISVQFVEGSMVILFYGVLMIAISFFLRVGDKIMPFKEAILNDSRLRQHIDRAGKAYTYHALKANVLLTGLGGFLTGLVSVGMGEVLMPQFLKKGKIPIEVAAGTSVLIVICTVFTAALLHVGFMIKGGGMLAVPWDLVCYTIPGVIIGGQIGPRLQGRIPQALIEKGISLVFLLIGISMIASIGN